MRHVNRAILSLLVAVLLPAGLSAADDTVPPFLVSAEAPPSLDRVLLSFSERMWASAAEDPFNYDLSTVGLGSIRLTDIRLDAGGRLVTAFPEGLLRPQTIYDIEVFEVRDLAGNVIVPLPTQARFETPSGDIDGPFLLSAEAPPSLDEVLLTFNEPMDALSVEDPLNYALSAWGGDPVGVAEVRLDAGGMMASLLPESLLLPQTLYDIEILHAEDLAGNAIVPSPTQTGFWTPQDNDPPFLVSAEAPPSLDRVLLSFSERMRASAAEDPFVYTLSTPALGSIGLADIRLDAGGTVVALFPEAPLLPQTRYEIEIDLAIDLVGNQMVPSPTRAAFQTPLPEPATLSLLALGGLALVRRRRR